MRNLWGGKKKMEIILRLNLGDEVYIKSDGGSIESKLEVKLLEVCQNWVLKGQRPYLEFAEIKGKDDVETEFRIIAENLVSQGDLKVLNDIIPLNVKKQFIESWEKDEGT